MKKMIFTRPGPDGRVDRITATVLDDHRVKLEVDKISEANHVQADQIVKAVASLMGGMTEVRRRPESERRLSVRSTEDA